MTSTAGGTTLAEILASTRILLLDFDGPVTPLMPDGIDRAIADNMRDVLHKMTGSVPAEVADTRDPLAVLRAAATESPDVLAAVEDACRAGEVDAAKRCEPTDGAHESMQACRDTGRPLIIVSNNAPEAIEAYLERHTLGDLVQEISARPPGRPDLMKPDPYLLRQVFRHRAERPDHYAFVGDSATDVQVSRATGVQSIGYAKSLRRGNELSEAGALVSIGKMGTLAAALRLALARAPHTQWPAP
jgi:phosphoglycolate phosphatase